MWEINPAWFLLLTLIGLVILAVFAYLKRQSYRLNRTLSQLYQLNQQLNQDPINLINQAWPLLKPIGINGYQAQVIWFGDKLDLQNGELKGRQQTYHLSDQLSNQDIQIDFSFYTPNLSGERRYFAQLVQQTFIHLLEHNIQTKINQILTTQAGVQRAQVFAQHNLKNLMQFINLLNSQLKKTTQPEQEHRLLQSLKHSVPSLQQRAERILSNLQPPHEPNNTTQPYTQHSETPQPIQLAHFIDQLAQPLFMPYEIQGDAHLSLPAGLVNEAFYNLLANFRDHNKNQAKLYITIQQQEKTLSIDFKQAITPEQAHQLNQHSVRLFEPFWTSSNSGMGLGLYIARQRIQRLAGQIQRIPCDNQAWFNITLPIK